ncbi:ABC transporter ATP-binding protein [Roseisalinus antarcticus]|uniref:Bicarbonate transport ATP-binding protein CmpD n=1 Tax=Roseisalinus antarcticus TaxID=254357 RepID=A0A1Y5TEF5_9RHOB|nr:ABC transporter ATP-binding protein [Roseisalinus antarcticus]SLN61956.1 Bicarbonate transport ATP-binding protein CmpD [Roseisalinus antarcticus]
MSMDGINLDGVSVRYDPNVDELALNDITLRIPAGQFVCIVGKSGGGKSTLVRTLAGLVKPSQGSLTVGGKAVEGPGEDRGMVFQEDTVFPWLRVQDNVEFGLRARSMPKQERSRKAQEWLAAVGLADAAGKWPRELSGGMRKRVALATVFATEPETLIMDEPFGALDFVTRSVLHSVLLDLWRQTETTIVFVTHDIEEALVLGDRILIVSDGGILADLDCPLPRPRLEDERSSPEALAITREIVRRLGLSAGTPEGPA